MIFRSLICKFFANNIRTRIMDLYVGLTYYTNLYHLCLLTTYKVVYYGCEILRIFMFTTYELVYGDEILWICMFSTIQIQYYELVHDLPKKNGDRKKHTNLHETAFAYRRKKLLSIKKGLPLEPRYVGICKFTTKIFQTQTQKGGWYNFFI